MNGGALSAEKREDVAGDSRHRVLRRIAAADGHRLSAARVLFVERAAVQQTLSTAGVSQPASCPMPLLSSTRDGKATGRPGD
jgi:hypothetical protein